jgi:hypothetical protein
MMWNIFFSLTPSLCYLQDFFTKKNPSLSLTDEDEIFASLSEKVNDYAHKMGIGQKIYICDIAHSAVKSQSLSLAVIKGSNMMKIYAPKILIEEDLDAFYFCLKHEIAHVLPEDSKNTLLGNFSRSILTGSLLGVFLSPYYSIPIGLLTNGLFSYLSSIPQIGEERADDWALEHASLEELKGGFRYMSMIEAIQRMVVTKGVDERLFKIIENDEEVSYMQDPNHPPISYRIRRLEKALLNCQMEAKFHATDIEKMTNFLNRLTSEDDLFANRNSQERENFVNNILGICNLTWKIRARKK